MLLKDTIDFLTQKITYRKYKRRLYRFTFGKMFDYYNCNFDEVISLGYNCEISNRLYDIFTKGNFEHYLYTYTYEHDRNSFLESLKNLENFVESEYSLLPWGMIKHEKYNIGFHSKYDTEELLKDDAHHEEILSTAIEELKSRIKHLSQKTENIFKSEKNILFIIKIKYDNFKDDFEFIKNLNHILQNKFTNKNAKYTLLVVLSKKNYPKSDLKKFLNCNLANVKVDTIKNFAVSAFADIDGDIFGWYKILKKYIKRKK